MPAHFFICLDELRPIRRREAPPSLRDHVRAHRDPVADTPVRTRVQIRNRPRSDDSHSQHGRSLKETMQYSPLRRAIPVECKLPAMRRMWSGAGALLLLLLPAACRKSQSTNVAATVNNRIITYAELDKNFQTQFPAVS